VTPAEAAAQIGATANEFARGAASVHDVWATFHSHLIPLWADEPLNGEFLQMFTISKRGRGLSAKTRSGLSRPFALRRNGSWLAHN
jgi:hypothetical protein